jgi:Zn-dependent peptidase ImmA (M78 family)/predicted secreted protein
LTSYAPQHSYDARAVGAHALHEAQRLFAEIGWDQREPIDVFAFVAALDITLMFRSFARLAGAYLPGTRSAPPIITVNEQHPLPRQRYSAAHELGHHFDKGEAVTDIDTEFLARGDEVKSASEYFAEAFAGWMLMPRRLVVSSMQQLNLKGPMTAEGAYRLSLALGTSYDATITQLRVLKYIGWSELHQLRKVPPKSTKERLLGEPRPNARADVWLVRDPQVEWLRPQPEDDVIVELPETPTSGYEWVVHPPSDVATVVKSEYRKPDDRFVFGAQGVRRLVLRVSGHGRHEVRLQLRSPYDPVSADERVLDMDVPAPREGHYVPDLVTA